MKAVSRERILTLALLLMTAAFVVRGSLLEPFLVPTGSMLPTVAIGDVLLVNKAAFWWRIPFKSDGGLSVGAPRRGQLIVFKKPGNESIFYVKRVVGVPGDVVMVLGRRVFINGKQWEAPQAAPIPWTGTGEGLDASLGEPWRLTVRDLEGNTRELLLQGKPTARIDRPGVWQVAPGQYFVMGDNRDTSNDSRDFGLVPQALLVGKVQGVLFNRPVEAIDHG